MTTQTSSLRERQRQERERLILQATSEALVEKGYDAMSMEEVANRIGISRAAIYLHFPSKEDLVLALLHRGVQSSAEQLDIILAQASSPREKVRLIIEQSYGGMSQPSFQVFSAILHSPTFLSKASEARKNMKGLWNPTLQRLTDVLEEGKQSGDFDPDMPTVLMVSLLGGLLSPFTYKRMVEEEQMPLAVVVKYLSRYFLKGVSPDHMCASPSSKAKRAVALDK
ncbi:MAG TPA: TetR/AcrR family transcriptional regulator [Ktedonobacterales bacterium]|jgi:AcrR family transcriptional regulator